MNEADIPIDIHTQKLQDWLISRRIVAKNIQPYIKDIRSKISNALEDMPSNEQLIKLLSGAYINYFHCKEIVEILKTTEKDTKSIFGSYGSQRMKDWQEILRLYEKDNLYLAEAAQIYVRNVQYEIPGTKKQIARFQQQSEEALKKIKDLNKSEQHVLAEHAALLDKLDVKGDNLRKEFTEALKKLPEIYNKSIENLASINDCIKYYSDFTKNTTRLPIIRHVIEFGNTTVYQYIHKEAPLSIEEKLIKLQLEEDPSASESNVIDFGDDDSSKPAEAIDFGDSVEESAGDIDWDINESSPAENPEIDFNIEEENPSTENFEIKIESSGTGGGVAKGNLAYTILDSPQYRDHFINELCELHSFLLIRVMELSTEDIASSILYAQHEVITSYDEDMVRKMLKKVEAILAEMRKEETLHFFHLKHSPDYAEILARKLKQHMRKVERIRSQIEQQTVKSEELKQKSVELKPFLDTLINQTKTLQGQIEKDISKRYKNRVVNLMGGVNAI